MKKGHKQDSLYSAQPSATALIYLFFCFVVHLRFGLTIWHTVLDTPIPPIALEYI